MHHTTVFSAQGQVLHRTWTIQCSHATSVKYKPSGRCRGFVYDSTLSPARCVCGWSAYRGTRAEARTRARQHRQRPAGMLTFRPSWCTDRGACNVLTTAVAVHVDDNRRRTAWAVAESAAASVDGLLAARRAVDVAVHAAVRDNALDALHVTADDLDCRRHTEVSLIVATPEPDDAGGGFTIVWAGRYSAWVWDGRVPTSVTAPLGRSGTRVAPSLHDLRTSAAGLVRTTGAHHQLVLASPAISDTLPAEIIARAARVFHHPRSVAHKLVVAARYRGSQANAAVLVTDRVPER